MDSARMFPAKVILCGEYSVLQNGKALVIPFDHFHAQWVYAKNASSIHRWRQLRDLLPRFELFDWVDVPRLTRDVFAGWYIETSIPMGYGLGSSGAFCAAILHRYGTKSTPPDYQALRGSLAEMEKVFHLTSSGVDPLVSYLAQPILTDLDHVTPITLDTPLALYLWDSGVSREGAEYVHLFWKKMEDLAFAKKWNENYIPACEKLIEQLINSRSTSQDWHQISWLQWEMMKDWIPPHCKKIWLYGLESGLFSMKICGAGGGGYFLIYTDTPQSVDLDLIPIFSSSHE